MVASYEQWELVNDKYQWTKAVFLATIYYNITLTYYLHRHCTSFLMFQLFSKLTRSIKVPEYRRIRFRFSFKFGRNLGLNRLTGAGRAGGGENGLVLFSRTNLASL